MFSSTGFGTTAGFGGANTAGGFGGMGGMGGQQNTAFGSTGGSNTNTFGMFGTMNNQPNTGLGGGSAFGAPGNAGFNGQLSGGFGGNTTTAFGANPSPGFGNNLNTGFGVAPLSTGQPAASTGMFGSFGGGNTQPTNQSASFGYGMQSQHPFGTANAPQQKHIEKDKDKIDTLMSLFCLPNYRQRLTDEARLEDYRAGFKPNQARGQTSLNPSSNLMGGAMGSSMGGLSNTSTFGTASNTTGSALFGNTGNSSLAPGGGLIGGNTGGANLFGGGNTGNNNLGGSLLGGGSSGFNMGGNTNSQFGGLGSTFNTNNTLGATNNTGGTGMFGGSSGGILGGSSSNLFGGGSSQQLGGNTGLSLGGGASTSLFGGGNTGGLSNNIPSFSLGGAQPSSNSLFAPASNSTLGTNLFSSAASTANRSPAGATGGLSLGGSLMGGGNTSIFSSTGSGMFGAAPSPSVNAPNLSFSNNTTLPNLGRSISSETVPYASGSESLMVHQTSLAKSDWVTENPEPAKKNEQIKASPKFNNEFEISRRPAITPRGYAHAHKLSPTGLLISKSKVIGNIATPSTAQKKKLIIDRSSRKDRTVESPVPLSLGDGNEDANTVDGDDDFEKRPSSNKDKEKGKKEPNQPAKPFEPDIEEKIDISDDEGDDFDFPSMSQDYIKKWYKVIPSIEVLRTKSKQELKKVSNFIVEREGFGKIEWVEDVDVIGLHVDDIIQIDRGEVIVYPDHIRNYPKQGEKLNRRAKIILYGIFPDENVISKEEAYDLFKESVEKPEGNSPPATFISYDLDLGELTFEVEHFTKYSIGASAKKRRTNGTESSTIQSNITEQGGQNSSSASSMAIETLPQPRESNIQVNNQRSVISSSELLHQEISKEINSVSNKNDIEARRQNILKPAFDLKSNAQSYVSSIYNRVCSEAKSDGLNNRYNPYHVRRSFRPSWGPNGELACLDEKTFDGHSKIVIVKIQGADIGSQNRESSAIKCRNLVSMLECHRKNCKSGSWSEMINGFEKISKNAAEITQQRNTLESNIYKHSMNIWKLFNSLWNDKIGKSNELQSGSDSLIVESPKCLISYSEKTEIINRRPIDAVHFLFREMSANVHSNNGQNGKDILLDINQLLLSNRFEEAIRLAIKSGNIRLATLIPQAISGDTHSQKLISDQIEKWQSQINQEENQSIIRLYQILSGNISAERSTEESWIRAFSLQIHFAERSHPLPVTFLKYKKSFENVQNKTESAPIPVPWYKNFKQFHNNMRLENAIYDSIFNILGFACEKQTNYLINALDPRGYTPDVLDWSLSWMMLQAFIGISNDDKLFGKDFLIPFELIKSSFIYQLESLGLWEWAIYVCLVKSNPNLHSKTIKSILARHIYFSNEFERKIVEQKLKWLHTELAVPNEWLSEGWSFKGNYSKLSVFDKIKGAVGSKRLNEFNYLLSNIIGPNTILLGCKEAKNPYLESLSEARSQTWFKVPENNYDFFHVKLFEYYFKARTNEPRDDKKLIEIAQVLQSNEYKTYLKDQYKLTLSKDKYSGALAHMNKKKIVAIGEASWTVLTHLSSLSKISAQEIKLGSLPIRHDKLIEFMWVINKAIGSN